MRRQSIRDLADLAERVAPRDGSGRSTDHYTRLWPTRPGQPTSDTPLFLACMLPPRLAALGLLWVTATPGRTVLLLAVLVVLAVLVLV